MLKQNAKSNLKRYYWRAFVVCLIIFLLSGGFSSYTTSMRELRNNSRNSSSSYNYNYNNSPSNTQISYEEGYENGYKLGYQVAEYTNEYSESYLDQYKSSTDAQYNQGLQEGFYDGYWDCFNGKQYDENKKSPYAEKAEQQSGVFAEFGNIKSFNDLIKAFNNAVNSSISNITGKQSSTYASLMVAFVIIFIIITIIFRIFILHPFETGEQRFFQRARIGYTQFSDFGSAFKRGRYFNIVKANFLPNFIIFIVNLLCGIVACIVSVCLFFAFSSMGAFKGSSAVGTGIYVAIVTLLIIIACIPGVILRYSYSLVPCIMAENATLKARRAAHLSRKIMKGEKWRFFVLQISFILWYLLGWCFCGIGVLFVNPYVIATYNEFYALMREKANTFGIADYGELPGFEPYNDNGQYDYTNANYNI